MGDQNTDTPDEMTIEGMESAMAVNDEMPIPEGEQQRAIEQIRAVVEREREIRERRRDLQPDPEVLERQAAYRDQVAERLASELNLAEEFEALRDSQQSTAQGTSGGDAGDADAADGDGDE